MAGQQTCGGHRLDHDRAACTDAATAARYVPEPPQPGSAEWFRIEREETRFRAMLNGRDPTDAEAAEHESLLGAIRDHPRQKTCG